MPAPSGAGVTYLLVGPMARASSSNKDRLRLLFCIAAMERPVNCNHLNLFWPFLAAFS